MSVNQLQPYNITAHAYRLNLEAYCPLVYLGGVVLDGQGWFPYIHEKQRK